MKVLLGVTSSIAAYRMPNFISRGRKQGHQFRTMVTGKALQFVTRQSLAIMSQHPCYRDRDEWGNTERILHIELTRWCDVLLIAPLTANTLAKLANGICDNLLTSAVRALGDKPLIIAPAMNTRMWENPFTARQIETLRVIYTLTVIEPIEKQLAEGEIGMGALAENEAILSTLQRIASQLP
ncbi:MAG TPA: flavoprotein [bacterium]|nr:flavoprotein [bacterium]